MLSGKKLTRADMAAELVSYPDTVHYHIYQHVYRRIDILTAFNQKFGTNIK